MTVESKPDPAAVAGGEVVGIPSMGQATRALARVLLIPRPALKAEVKRVPSDLLRVLAGRSTITPGKDRRFADPAWSENPIFRRLAQAYLAGQDSVRRLLDDLDISGEDPRSVERARLAAELLLAALAPTNLIFTNPAGLKRAFDTGGGSVVKGAANFAHDVRHNKGLPTTVDREPFEVGRDVAVSPGAVIDRDDIAEVLQYTTTTATVHARPLLIVPPPIGRFYFLDLRPGRSFVEYATSQGFQVFLMSWRNPGPSQGDWGLDDYAARVSSAIDTVLEVTGQPDANLIGFCAGGIVATTLLNHMAATGDERVHSVSYGVTLLDFELRAPLAAFQSRGLLGLARRRSARTGVITSQQMGAAFTLMRPNDLIFNYVVNNYVLGNKPPAFDILAWNADGTNLPARLHGQFLDIFRDNSLVTGAGLSVLGTPIDLTRVKVPFFVTGALTDHLTPWKGCYRTTQMLGGEPTFVLSYSGHIASLVNPPGNPKAHYWTNDTAPADPEEWRANAERHSGSWWEAWANWFEQHAGDRAPAPASLGSKLNPPLEPAPGRYVRARPAS
ncbi:alpha/beta fold hydrolase [Nocardioides immobilis]|uniref:Alpha/beta fold hydrolase n=1 Tax=Nocardioides immobilis TaxID=2049295 RepID=A0A417Y133_9ACTN|nr:alpha/beta fold hydrolase [Nocardioides immobilis]RHW26277.1 alpha/beta fold hydrolase [Nocardioides immobilis]